MQIRYVTAYVLSATAIWSVAAAAEEPVHFSDARLEAAVEASLGKLDPTPADMLSLTSLSAAREGICDLGGIEYAANLTDLDLYENPISGLSALSGLTHLTKLDLIADRVKDVSPLSSLTSLSWLGLSYNQIADVSALRGLSGLHTLVLYDNPLNRDAYCKDLQAIKDANPGLALYFPANANPPGGVMASDGSFGDRVRITWQALCPGPGSEQIFQYVVYRADSWAGARTAVSGELSGTSFDDTTVVQRVHYFYWVGSSGSHQSSDADEGWACFESVLDELYVDDQSPSDPGPGDPNLSDPKEDGTVEHPFDRIQEAIDVAKPISKVIVRPGVYMETIDLLGKEIELYGLNMDEPNVIAAYPVIDAQGKGTAVRCTRREDPNCVLRGFVITGGLGRLAGGVLCEGSSPRIEHCLIVGNRATAPEGAGGGIWCQDSHATFVNCTITGNYGGVAGAGAWFKDSPATVTNSIVWGNGPLEILASGTLQPTVRYTDVAGGWPGAGIPNADPLFAWAGHWADPKGPAQEASAADAASVWRPGDYHLKSRAGRWDPASKVWVKDAVTSPCIDGGDPAWCEGAEPVPNGRRINMGAYGGTNQASRSGE